MVLCLSTTTCPWARLIKVRGSCLFHSLFPCVCVLIAFIYVTFSFYCCLLPAKGLDILQIMRNIHIFVERFTYNMNTQQFVEFRPDKNSKHINTIKTQSIAASLRQHGLGVLNTTVNFTYQFLSQKFSIFSQFLFDDYIRAHLSREYRWYKKNKNSPEVNNHYPYDRAMKFVKDIRKLGVNEEKKTFLDQFRILITEIGNALGYVRMVRSASMYYCSEAVKFLPELDDIIKFEHHAGKGSEAAAASFEDEEAPATTTPAVPVVVRLFMLCTSLYCYVCNELSCVDNTFELRWTMTYVCVFGCDVWCNREPISAKRQCELAKISTAVFPPSSKTSPKEVTISKSWSMSFSPCC